MSLNLSTSISFSLLATIIGLSIIVAIPSCSDPINPPLSKAMKKTLDSLFQDQVMELDSIADVNCEEIYPKAFQKAKDSLYSLRLEEIKSILDQ